MFRLWVYVSLHKLSLHKLAKVSGLAGDLWRRTPGSKTSGTCTARNEGFHIRGAQQINAISLAAVLLVLLARALTTVDVPNR